MNHYLILPFKYFYRDKTLSYDVIIFSTLLIFLPAILITGRALSDIFLTLIACFFLFKSLINKNWFYYKNPITIGFILFSSYGIIRSLFIETPLDSLTNEGSVFYFRYIFFAMGVWYLFDINPHLPKCFVIVSILSLIIVCLDGLFQYFNGVNLFGIKYYSVDRLTGLFGDEPILGRYIAYLSIFTFVLIYQNYEKSKKMMIFSISLLIMCEVMVFLSGERAPFFTMSLFTVLVIVFIPHFRVYRIVGFLISISLISLIIQVNPIAKNRMVDYTINQVSQTKIPFLPYSPHHEEHYVSAIKMFVDNPLFGVGTNTFRNECDKEKYKYKERSCSSHPHNFYLQVLAELGTLGFLFIISLFFYLFYVVSRQFLLLVRFKKDKLIPFEIFLYPIILFVFWWPILPHMSLYNNWNNVFMMLPLGLFMKYLNKY